MLDIDSPFIQEMHNIITHALQEDQSQQDITTRACLNDIDKIHARLILKEDAFVFGLHICAFVFLMQDCNIKIQLLANEQWNRKGTCLAALEGSAHSILSAERSALNILQHLSGIATLTHQCVLDTRKQCDILDTRKTLPMLRLLQKKAVKAAGGTNHRLHLADQILIKTTHLHLLQHKPNPITLAIKRAKIRYPEKTITIEITNPEDVVEAIEAQADRILLDNMTVKQIQKSVYLADNRIYLECSGNITRDNIQEIAQTGIHGISMGSLTNSAKAIDVSLRVSPFS
jgi:nicotinate-nucleotide pyrophosphorylase (carboxylating)